MTQWIDTHVHLFTEATKGEAPALIDGKVNTTEHYLQSFGDNTPAGVVVVDYSKASSSAHVVATVDELVKRGIPTKGIIRANLADENTWEWLRHPHIAGARLYALADVPDLSANKAGYDKLFSELCTRKQHLCLFGKPANLRALIKQIPDDLTLLIDHLGMPDALQGTNQHDYNQLLADCAARHKSAGAVYFKGPGYRTSFDPARTAPFLQLIIEKLGDTQLMLGASDAPFAGPVMEASAPYAGKNNTDFVSYQTILPWLNILVEKLAPSQKKSVEMLQMQLLYSNAHKLYGFEKKASKAA
jgi:predicted TIM-barrel fold metal-dependent hydrolase